MENRIKECQLDLFADRTSTATMPTSCGCGWPLSPTFSSAPCAASPSSTPSSPRPTAQPSVSSCSRSARSCGFRSAASSSPWPHPSPTSANRGSRTPGSPPRRRTDEPDSAQSSYWSAFSPRQTPLARQNTSPDRLQSEKCGLGIAKQCERNEWRDRVDHRRVLFALTAPRRPKAPQATAALRKRRKSARARRSRSQEPKKLTSISVAPATRVRLCTIRA